MNLLKYKEAVFFCLAYSISFVLMQEIVRTVNPVTSTFLTYGFTALFFLIFNIRNLKYIMQFIMKYKKETISINISTLVNTYLAYLVMTYVPSIVYALIFFSSLPFISSVFAHKSKVLNSITGILQLAVFTIALLTGFLTNQNGVFNGMIGILLTILSAVFAVHYMVTTSKLHKETSITTPQLLSIRFFLVIIVCGGYTMFLPETLNIQLIEISLIFGASILGSIIPLFFLQKSIQKLGSSIVAQFTPPIPILCMIFLHLSGKMVFTLLEMFMMFTVSILLAMQARGWKKIAIKKEKAVA